MKIKILIFLIIVSFLGCKKEADPGGNGGHYPGVQEAGPANPGEGTAFGKYELYYSFKENYVCSYNNQNINSYFEVLYTDNSKFYAINSDYCTQKKIIELPYLDPAIVKSKDIETFPKLLAYKNSIYEKKKVIFPMDFSKEKYILAWCYDDEHTVYIEKNMNQNTGKIYYFGFDGSKQIRSISFTKAADGFVFVESDEIIKGEISINKSQCSISFANTDYILSSFINN